MFAREGCCDVILIVATARGCLLAFSLRYCSDSFQELNSVKLDMNMTLAIEMEAIMP